ncbi:MAG: hypothetical protein JST09_13945 [Bacteroidetes bacterium]|nr:hypothetical protein [Bacteroidota bacterium]
MEKRIEEALNSFDGIQRASPQPFFYTRLKARLNQPEKGIWENVSSFITQPAMLFATVFIILLLNISILYKNHISAPGITAADQLEQTPSDAFDVASNTNTTIYTIWSQDNEQRIQK